jgi:hypothetical protein
MPPFSRRGATRLGHGLLTVLLCLAAVVALLNVEVLPLGAVRVPDLASDYGLLTWNFWSTTEAARHGQSLYRTRFIYHPVGSNLAAHTLGPGFVPIGLAARALRGGRPDYPLYAHRLAIMACFTLGLWLALLALRALGADGPSALAAAAGWTFAPLWRPMLANQTLASGCFLLPAVAHAAITLGRRPSTPRAVALAVLVGSSPYFSEYYGAFIPIALAAAVVALLASREGRTLLAGIARALGPRGLVLAAGAGCLAALPLLLGWWGAEGRPPGQRQIVVGGANLAGFLVPDPVLSPVYSAEALARLHALVRRGSAPFLGLATLGLAAVGAAVTCGLKRRLLLTLAVLFLVLSLGPVLRVFGTNTGLPLPYALLARVPPFHLAREPQRLAAFALWALVSLAALGLAALNRGLGRRFGRVAAAGLVGMAAGVWLAEGYSPGAPPVRFVPPPELAALPPGAVIDLPLTITDGLAMFLQIYHGRPIVTGYVSRASPGQFEHVRRLQELLETDPQGFVAAMRRLHVGTAILHPGTTDEQAREVEATGLRVVDLRQGLTLEPVR